MTANDRRIKTAREKRGRKKRRLKKSFVAFLIILSVTAAAFLSLTVFFPVKSVEINGKSIYSNERIISELGLEKGDKFVPLLFNGSKNRLLESFPYIKSISYGYSLSGKLTVKITPYTASVQFFTGEKYAVAADDMTILEILPSPENDLPVYKVPDIECDVRKKAKFANETQKTAFFELRSAANDQKIALKEADFTSVETCDVTTSDDITVRLGAPGTYGKKMRMVSKILKTLPAGETGTIDISSWTPENKKASYLVKSNNP